MSLISRIFSEIVRFLLCALPDSRVLPPFEWLCSKLQRGYMSIKGHQIINEHGKIVGAASGVPQKHDLSTGEMAAAEHKLII